jgi:hypothetical protein
MSVAISLARIRSRFESCEITLHMQRGYQGHDELSDDDILVILDIKVKY